MLPAQCLANEKWSRFAQLPETWREWSAMLLYDCHSPHSAATTVTLSCSYKWLGHVAVGQTRLATFRHMASVSWMAATFTTYYAASSCAPQTPVYMQSACGRTLRTCLVSLRGFRAALPAAATRMPTAANQPRLSSAGDRLRCHCASPATQSLTCGYSISNLPVLAPAPRILRCCCMPDLPLHW